MKIFFDTNVHIADALLGKAATRMLEATRRGKWRMFTSQYVLDEVGHVLVDDLGFSSRLAILAQRRILRRFVLVKGHSKAIVPLDPKDSPILQAALLCGADYLVSNDRHLLVLDPFEGLRIISMDRYWELLKSAGLLK
ncbi:MAG: putative toxin-antitoxin system toxin component, PIN family [Phycisphaerae bacterium]